MRFTSPLVAKTLSASRIRLRLTRTRDIALLRSAWIRGERQETTRSLCVATIDPLAVGQVDAIFLDAQGGGRRAGAPCTATGLCTAGLRRFLRRRDSRLMRSRSGDAKRRDTRSRRDASHPALWPGRVSCPAMGLGAVRKAIAARTCNSDKSFVLLHSCPAHRPPSDSLGRALRQNALKRAPMHVELA